MVSKNRTELVHNQQEAFFNELNQTLSSLQIPFNSKVEVDALPVIYIIGAPRSGTTLVYQLICKCFSVGYINNLAARFWLRPSIGVHLTKSLFNEDLGRKHITFQSELGRTNGAANPHEFGYFWSHWFRSAELSNHTIPNHKN